MINDVIVNNRRSINTLPLIIRDCCFLCTEWLGHDLGALNSEALENVFI